MAKGGSKKNHRGLTAQRQHFCDYYLADPNRNAKAAYIAAYPSVGKKTAEVNASKLLRDTKVLSYIEKEDERVRGRLLKQFEINEERIIKELSYLAFISMSDLASWGPSGIKVIPSDKLDEAIKRGVTRINHSKNKYGVSWSIDLSSRLKALELLGKRLGMW